MDIRFVLPSEVEQLARNVVTSFPSKTPAALLQNMEGCFRPVWIWIYRRRLF